jgi:hypothetical protein
MSDVRRVLTELADQFQQQADRCQAAVGAVDCALEAAVVWEAAAKRVRKKLAEANNG